MPDLEDGKKCWEYKLKPGPGFFTLQSIRLFLGVRPRTLHRYCKALGIELTPFVRRERHVVKVYKNQYRWLTEREAKRILSYHYAQKNLRRRRI